MEYTKASGELRSRFGLGATTAGPNQQDVLPAAIVPVMSIGITKFDTENNLTVDAAKINPKPANRLDFAQRLAAAFFAYLRTTFRCKAVCAAPCRPS